MGVSSTTPGVSKLDAPVLYSRCYKTKRRNSFWAVAPLLFVVTVLTPATTWMEGFTNHLIAKDYTQDISGWQCLSNKAVLSMPNGAASPAGYIFLAFHSVRRCSREEVFALAALPKANAFSP